jgi:hypothetical protein
VTEQNPVVPDRERELCGDRGPRIGGEGCPACVHTAGHLGDHAADDSWGASVTWSTWTKPSQSPVVPDATKPVLIDRDGDEWHWINGGYHATSSSCTRDEINQVWGPLTERPRIAPAAGVPTAARDHAEAASPEHRAWSRAHERAVAIIADGLYPEEQQETGNYGTARAVLAILRAHPEVLRALAGASTPDVTAELERLRAMEQRAEKVKTGVMTNGAPWQQNAEIADYILNGDA